MPQNVTAAKDRNKEKSYKKFLETKCSDQWKRHLEIELGNPPGRLRAYVRWHLHSKLNRNMYKPAPYLTHQSAPFQLELLRIRTQSMIHLIPTHLHYGIGTPRADYEDRVCPYCLMTGTQILGDEVHIICHCPTTKGVLEKFTDKFIRLMRVLDLPPFATFDPEEKTRIVLGNPPSQVLNKTLKNWIREATPVCGEFVHFLRMHITTIQLTKIDMSSDDDSAESSSSDDEASPILLPTNFAIAPSPPRSDTLEPLNPAGQQMVGQHIMYKWPKHGWCTGKITECNDNPKTKIGKMIVNFVVLYTDDNSLGPHCLSLENFNHSADDDSPNHTWIMINPSP